MSLKLWLTVYLLKIYEIGSTNTVTNKVAVTNSDINLLHAYFTYIGLMQNGSN